MDWPAGHARRGRQQAVQRTQGRDCALSGRYVRLQRRVGERVQEVLPGLYGRDDAAADAGGAVRKRKWGVRVPGREVLRGAQGRAVLHYGWGREELFAEVRVWSLLGWGCRYGLEQTLVPHCNCP